jgi:hypothetical protein
MTGGEVEKYYREGRIREVADYCESDVVNTYRVWLRYELFRGRLAEAEFQASEAHLANFINERGNTKPHLQSSNDQSDRTPADDVGRGISFLPTIPVRSEPAPVPQITDLWVSSDPQAWEDALERYWNFVQRRNLALEQSLDTLDLERIRGLDPRGWYDFLMNEYFRWKYVAPNRYATTTRQLRRYFEDDALVKLDDIRHRLLNFNTDDVRSGLKIASEILGLGTAGASGLLALMYPRKFGTVDQFAVKALRQVNGLPEAACLEEMNPEALTIRDGVLLIGILRRKATETNLKFKSDAWTPRKLDKILWTYGR